MTTPPQTKVEGRAFGLSAFDTHQEVSNLFALSAGASTVAMEIQSLAPNNTPPYDYRTFALDPLQIVIEQDQSLPSSKARLVSRKLSSRVSKPESVSSSSRATTPNKALLRMIGSSSHCTRKTDSAADHNHPSCNGTNERSSLASVAQEGGDEPVNHSALNPAEVDDVSKSIATAALTALRQALQTALHTDEGRKHFSSRAGINSFAKVEAGFYKEICKEVQALSKQDNWGKDTLSTHAQATVSGRKHANLTWQLVDSDNTVRAFRCFAMELPLPRRDDLGS